MKTLIRKIAFLAAAALALPAAAHAQPSAASVVWTLNDFTFAGGATATGSFEWAPDTDQILSWDITMSSRFYAGSNSQNSPLRYSSVLPYNSVTSNSGFLKFTANGGWDLFSFSFGVVPANLDVASARVDLAVTNLQYESWNFLECNSGCSSRRSSGDITSAYLSSVSGVPELSPDVTTVPEPGTYVLMLGGLACLGGAAHRRRARA